MTIETAGRPRRVGQAIAVLAVVAVGIFATGLIIGFAVIGSHGGGAIQGVDDTIGHWYLGHRSPLVGVSKFVATYLDALPLGIACLVLSAVLALTLRSVRAVVPLVAYLGGEVEVFLIRQVILRPRPPTANFPAPGAVRGVHETGYSFPSGHAVAVTAVLFALLGTLALAYRTWWPWVIALVASLFVADTRLVLGVHWFSDVAFGVLFGIVWGTTVALAARAVDWSDLTAMVHRGRGHPRTASPTRGRHGRHRRRRLGGASPGGR